MTIRSDNGKLNVSNFYQEQHQYLNANSFSGEMVFRACGIAELDINSSGVLKIRGSK